MKHRKVELLSPRQFTMTTSQFDKYWYVPAVIGKLYLRRTGHILNGCCNSDKDMETSGYFETQQDALDAVEKYKNEGENENE